MKRGTTPRFIAGATQLRRNIASVAVFILLVLASVVFYFFSRIYLSSYQEIVIKALKRARIGVAAICLAH